ncbi:MAG: 2-hydroxyglutaryl-CoA dehydratase [Candidatus Omnitrophica bacterium]|nr:2-hydroxyglutaryl-CoA dehydratase [Candidatus Omnitrophota bacterium]
MLYAGVDVGSRTIKVVVIDEGLGQLIASGICDQGVRQAALAHDLFKQVLGQAGLGREDVSRVIATGYGRSAVEWADAAVTEITCQAYGVIAQVPNARTIIDIGGQDSKVIRLDERGLVYDFVMNDRCAAGTGRFLEIVAVRLETGLKDLGAMAEKAACPSIISSMCAVFAETEIVGLLAAEEAPANLAAGVQHSVARRIVAMLAGRVNGPVVFTGGVALIPGMARALSDALDRNVIIAEAPQMTAARGAALIACGQARRTAGASAEVGKFLEAVQ